jgi:hypothetical protein
MKRVVPVALIALLLAGLLIGPAGRQEVCALAAALLDRHPLKVRYDRWRARQRLRQIRIEAGGPRDSYTARPR